jgi:predicted ATPase
VTADSNNVFYISKRRKKNKKKEKEERILNVLPQTNDV